MAKPKITWKICNYGIYKNWDKSSKDLPDIQKHTETIPARIGIEFGYILNIKKAKGKKPKAKKPAKPEKKPKNPPQKTNDKNYWDGKLWKK